MSDSKSTEELRRKLCECLNIFPEEIQHHLPVNIGESNIRDLEQLFDQELAKRVEEAIELFRKDMGGWDYDAYLEEKPDQIQKIVMDCAESSARYVRKTLKTQTTEEDK